jgi:hypothetical protein
VNTYTHAAAVAVAVQVYAVREYDPSTEERSSSHRAYQPPRPNLEALMEVTNILPNIHTCIYNSYRYIMFMHIRVYKLLSLIQY